MELTKIRKIFYPVLAAVSIPVNLLVILVLLRGKCGLSRCITCYLLAMASADLTVILTDVILKQIIPLYSTDPFTNNITLCGLIDSLTHAATDLAVWFTVAFTFDRFVAICCQKLKAKYCTWKTAVVIIGTVTGLSCLKNIPWYYRYDAVYFFFIPLFCMVKLSYYSSPQWKAFDLLHRITTPLLPFVLIAFFNALTVRNILLASKARRRLRGQGDKENQKDPEMENRRKSILLLFSISASFILLWMTQAVYTIHERITLNHIIDRLLKNRLPFVIGYIGPMLQLLSSCSNTCIYVVTQSKFREDLKNVLTCPFVLVLLLVK
ncbi:probable G-protein coupled receptor 139 [Chiloscyllium plagiosum]|uniref:probable G-protein coupled receptor 139 n=1 Tax=Chiloscyllium plagiosum TaxID=36176 RepID=UPI001CB844D3|nr:probable G-protein coupled receptor 139 [Chiloscyllium plagiosum]